MRLEQCDRNIVSGATEPKRVRADCPQGDPYVNHRALVPMTHTLNIVKREVTDRLTNGRAACEPARVGTIASPISAMNH